MRPSAAACWSCTHSKTEQVPQYRRTAAVAAVRHTTTCAELRLARLLAICACLTARWQMAPKCPPSQTVALCGLSGAVGREEIQKLLDKHAKGVVTSFSEPRKDTSDKEGLRKMVFVNCSSADAAAKVCQALHEKEDAWRGLQWAHLHKLGVCSKN